MEIIVTVLYIAICVALFALAIIVHEFGHFNAAYHDPTPSLYVYSALDVSEVEGSMEDFVAKLSEVSGVEQVRVLAVE